MASILTAGLPPTLAAGDLVLHTTTHVLSGPAGSSKVDIGPFPILRALMSRPGTVFTMAQLIEAAWADPDLEAIDPERAVRTRVCRARKAIELVGGSPAQLATVWGCGYVMHGEQRIVRSYTREQAALLDQLLVSHPDRTAVAELAPC